MRTAKYVIMASGQGSNARALTETGLAGGFPPELIIVNKKESPLFSWAQEKGIECQLIESTQKGIDLEFENKVLSLCKAKGITWVFLAGFLKILSGNFLKYFFEGRFNRVVNIHPSLLPKYPGLSSYKKAFENNDSVYGHTIHLVTAEVDRGPHLFQKELKKEKNDSFETFVERGKSQENESYSYVLHRLATDGIALEKEGLSLSLKENSYE